jgi:2-polyprenyl-3-methyl-5-hydroxy-6-metoxy-1,4-benzoquinol methylase
MREFDPIPESPATPRKADKTIANKILASYRDREFYDGSRENGYGGYKDDGRWGPVADHLIKVYGLTEESSVLQINCHKGFLVKEFNKRGIYVRGTEVSRYAISCIPSECNGLIRYAPFTDQPFSDEEFDLVLAMSPVYAGNVGDAITVLKEVERLKKRGGSSFVTLGTYENQTDYWLLRKWYTLGSLLLTKDEWRELMTHAGYSGDYRFDTACYLKLQ